MKKITYNLVKELRRACFLTSCPTCSLKQLNKNSTYWMESSRECRKICHEKRLPCAPVCKGDLTQKASEASSPRRREASVIPTEGG